MNSIQFKLAAGYTGWMKGTAASSTLKATARRTVRHDATGATYQVYEASLTIAGAATTTLDLTSGLTSPLGETISGSLDFARVFGVYVEHDAASANTTGIEVFGGASSNKFQGPHNATGKMTLKPKQHHVFLAEESDAVGWVVSGTAKNIDILNLHATLASTVHVLIIGKTA